MLFGEMWLEMEKLAIFARSIREASNLEVKLDLKSGFDNWYFEGHLYFTVPVIMARKSKSPEKNGFLRGCNLKNVFVSYLNFLEITDPWPYFNFHENSVF